MFNLRISPLPDKIHGQDLGELRRLHGEAFCQRSFVAFLDETGG